MGVFFSESPGWFRNSRRVPAPTREPHLAAVEHNAKHPTSGRLNIFFGVASRLPKGKTRLDNQDQPVGQGSQVRGDEVARCWWRGYDHEVEPGANLRNSFTQAPRSQDGVQIRSAVQLARRHQMQTAASERLDKVFNRARIQKGSCQSAVVLDAEVR